MTLKEDLKNLIKGDVFDDAKTLDIFSRDASILEVMPELVVAPKDVGDLKSLVKFVSERKKENPKLSLTARSAGTDMSGGPLNESIILDFLKYFNKIKEVSDDGYAITEPGVFYRDFENESKKKGFIFPSYPASKELCSLGGIVSNNSGGEKNPAFGKTENYVMELKVVLSDGNEYTIMPLNKSELELKMNQKDFEGDLYRRIFKLVSENSVLLKEAKPKVSKNSAGYYLWNIFDGEIFDLTKLIVGSQGTLGLVTEIKLRLVPVTKYSKLLVIFLRDIKNLAQIVNTVLPHKPESVESYDDNTLKLAFKFMPDIIKRIGPKNIFKFLLSFIPEVKMILTGGFPKLVILVEFTSNEENNIYEKMNALNDDLKKFKIKTHISKTDEESNKYWTIRRESFALLRKHVHGKHAAPFIDDIIVQPVYLPEFLPKLNKILEDYDFIHTVAGHVGDGNFHIIPLLDLSKKSNYGVIPEIIERVFNLVLEYKGSITAEHNDGIIRTPYLKKMFGDEVIKLFEETKNIFDPKNIFNPHKKVGSGLKYMVDHIMHHNM
ncbi:MAG: FAD-binding oxidoreductase [Patescibacteria group bacterium]